MEYKKRNALLFATLLTLIVGITLSFNYTRNKLKSIQSESSNAKMELLGEISALRKDISATTTPPPAERTTRYWTAPGKRMPVLISRSERIAHAGGALHGQTYTNSIEALESNKEHFSIFEIDMAFTSDEVLVCSHDWDHYPTQVFGTSLDGPPSFAEFIALTEANPRFTNCTMDTLINWLEENPDTYIVTDVKVDNMKALTYISEKYPGHLTRFKPQIYNMGQYEEARNLGFVDIILTIYNWDAPDSEIVQSTHGVELFAVTVPHFRAPSIAKKLKEAGNRVYAHTVNSKEAFSNLQWFEIDEIYTDTLID